MCNEFSRTVDLDLLRIAYEGQRIGIHFPEGIPNAQPSASIRITDPALIVRAAAGASPDTRTGEPGAPGTPLAAELVTRRWSWPGPAGKPVYNYRSEGRDFRNSAKQGRCLIPVDGFYEFTAPADPAKKRKDKWLFRWKGEDVFCIAGLWKRDEAAITDSRGEAFTLLTCEPGPDIAPYHRRQVVLLDRRDWAGWLSGRVPAPALMRPLPAGTLAVEQVG
jgi:putative SOS response-associated peptidase YedK